MADNEHPPTAQDRAYDEWSDAVVEDDREIHYGVQELAAEGARLLAYAEDENSTGIDWTRWENWLRKHGPTLVHRLWSGHTVGLSWEQANEIELAVALVLERDCWSLADVNVAIRSFRSQAQEAPR